MIGCVHGALLLVRTEPRRRASARPGPSARAVSRASCYAVTPGEPGVVVWKTAQLSTPQRYQPRSRLYGAQAPPAERTPVGDSQTKRPEARTPTVVGRLPGTRATCAPLAVQPANAGTAARKPCV